MLHRRFFGYFLVLSALTIAATVAFEAWSFRRAIDHSLRQNLLFARSVAGAVSAMVEERSAVLDDLLQTTARTDAEDAKAVAAAVAAARVRQPGCDGAAVFDGKRQLVGADVGPGGFVPVDVLLPALRRAEQSGQLVATSLWRGRDNRPRVALVKGMPIGPKDGGRWLGAVLHLRADDAAFSRPFEHFLVNDQSRLQLLDAAGVALFSNVPGERFRSAVHGTYFTDKVRLGAPAQMACHSCHKGPDAETVRENEATTVAPIVNLDWVVTVREGTRDLYAPMRETILMSTLLVSLIFGLFVGYYLLVARRVLLPMRQLVRAAQAIGGDPDRSPLAVAGRDEFALLAESLQALRSKSELAPPPAQPPPVAELRGNFGASASLPKLMTAIAESVAGSPPVCAAILCATGRAAGDELSAVAGASVRCEGSLPGVLEAAAAGRDKITVAELQEKGIALADAGDTQFFVVQRIAVGDVLRGALWIGLGSFAPELLQMQLPTLSLLAAQVQSLLERTILYDQLHAEQQRKNRMLRHLFEAEAEERRRIAREIHDDTAQELTALLLVLETLPEGSADAERKNLERAKQLVQRTLDGINRLVRRLRPAVLDDLGLVEAVRTTGHNVLETAGVQFSLDVQGDEWPVPPDTENLVYRVFQEAATNVVRHAKAQHMTVRLQFEQDRLLGWFEDDGCGMDLRWLDDLHARPRWGILGIRERIVQSGGSVEFSVPAGGGLRIVFEIPIFAKEDGHDPASQTGAG